MADEQFTVFDGKLQIDFIFEEVEEPPADAEARCNRVAAELRNWRPELLNDWPGAGQEENDPDPVL